MNKKKEIFLLGLIILLGAFLRLHGLQSAPPGLYPDEAINANQALEEPGKLFYPENHGREGLFVNMLALSFKIFGVSIPAARAVPALFGTLTLFGVYLLARELFNKNTALWAVFFLALSFWHINFSRILFRAILAPFFLTFAFYFLVRGARRNKTSLLIAAGLLYGLGFHTYISYRFTVLLLPIFLLLFKDRKDIFKTAVPFLGATFLAGLPIGLYFLRNPGHFWARGGVGVFTQENGFWLFLKSAAAHLGQLFVIGDPNWRHNIGGAPALRWPVALAFLAGLYRSLKRLDFPHLLLISWWLILLLPGALTYEGIPHHLRTLLVIPPVFILVGSGAHLLTRKAELKERPFLVKVGLGLFLLALVLGSYLRYFDTWARDERTESAFFADSVRMSYLLDQAPERTRTFVVLNEEGDSSKHLPLPTESISFMERVRSGKRNSRFIFRNELDGMEVSKDVWLVPLDISPELLQEMNRVFPDFKAVRTENGVYFKP